MLDLKRLIDWFFSPFCTCFLKFKFIRKKSLKHIQCHKGNLGKTSRTLVTCAWLLNDLGKTLKFDVEYKIYKVDDHF